MNLLIKEGSFFMNSFAIINFYQVSILTPLNGLKDFNLKLVFEF